MFVTLSENRISSKASILEIKIKKAVVRGIATAKSKHIYKDIASLRSNQFRCCVVSDARNQLGEASHEAVPPLTLDDKINFHGVHHIGLLCKDLDISLRFYRDFLGLEVNPDRPHANLPYRGAWLWIGKEMIHLMELPNPDPPVGRPEHGGKDRHLCVSLEKLDPLIKKLKKNNIKYTESMSGRRALFFRDPDMNCLECFETRSHS